MSEVSIKHFDDKYLEQTEKLIKEYPEIFTKEEYTLYRQHLLQNLAEKSLIKKAHRTLILVLDDIVVGAVMFRRAEESDEYFKIEWLVVKNGEQGKGYGSMLMKEAFRHIKELHGKYVYVETSHEKKNEPTKKFYEHLGMSEMGVLPNYYPPPVAIEKRKSPEDYVIYYRHLS